jgi:hypothetical protein
MTRPAGRPGPHHQPVTHHPDVPKAFHTFISYI